MQQNSKALGKQNEWQMCREPANNISKHFLIIDEF